MNTWVVGNAPIGHYVLNPRPATDKAPEVKGEKTFFMKGRIMAGQADVSKNVLGYDNFKWLTREEIQRLVRPKYFSYVKNMLAER